jgi:aspartate aminotransferase
MLLPKLSEHYESRIPSAVRIAQIEFSKRTDSVEAINTAIGNVPIPLHPAIQKRMFSLNAVDSPFHTGVVQYTQTAGEKEANDAFLNVIASSGFSVDGLYSMVTDGGSAAMELILLGVCGPAGSNERPLMVIDPAYANYIAFAKRLGRETVCVSRTLDNAGRFCMPSVEQIEKAVERYNPGGLVIIPYDNPTGNFYSQEIVIKLAEICVKHNVWMISDEAYRELNYNGISPSSIWGLSDKNVPGIEGRRISVETTSKVWNGCGLRIGALVTDNEFFHKSAVAEYTTNLCANSIGQYIFGAIAHESKESLQEWYAQQRHYYKSMITELRFELENRLPGVIISLPDAAIYAVVDVKNIAKPGFKSSEFAIFCAREGKVNLGGEYYTLLTSPMSGFYSGNESMSNPGDTQMRIAFVEKPEKMILLPHLFAQLFDEFEQLRKKE